MPNHVENDLIVTGAKAEIDAFIAFAKEGDYLLSANKFISYPKKYTDLDEKTAAAGGLTSGVKDGFNSGGYEWCCKNWGTKWGIYEAKLKSRKPQKATFTFLSARSPPLPIIKAMSKRFPALTFHLAYYESGAGYQGVYWVVAGKEFVQKSERYSGSRGG